MRILVAEDDTNTREFLCFMLTRGGHEVDGSADGARAWEKLKRERYALLLADCLMPQMDGFELCRKLRTAERPYTYVIMLSAYGGRENYFKGMDAGADDFLTKPCDFDELRARLRVAERVLSLSGEKRPLPSLLPICTYCKRIRESEAEWVAVEAYVARRTGASFSHGICPECFGEHVRPEIERHRSRRDT